PNLIPTGITVLRNHFFKQLSWYVNDPSYAGVHWSVKNLFELKNARQVLIEGNTFENNWADAQSGPSILFTPRPSDSGPAAVLEDVNFQKNIIKNVASVIHLLGQDSFFSQAPNETRLRRVHISNNVFENINGPRFAGNGAFVQVISGTEDVTVESNTVFHTGN